MLISGTKTTPITTAIIDTKCSYCGISHHMQMTVLQEYVHVFWIPFFPIMKTGSTVCSHCKQVLKKKEFSNDLNSIYSTLLVNSKIPMWTFSGLAALLSLMIVVAAIGKYDHDKYERLLSTAQKGDIYKIKKDDSHFTLYKVDNINGDTVQFLVSEIEATTANHLEVLLYKRDSLFRQEPLPILKKRLATMLRMREIVSIERKE